MSPHPRSSADRWAVVEWAALALAVAVFVWRGLRPAWSTINTDFPNYYLSARLYLQGSSLDRLYDWVWFERQKDHAGIDWGPIGYGVLTPFSALVLVPLAWLPALAAKRVWLVLNLALLAATIGLLRAMSAMPARRIALIAFASVLPLRTNFLYGQQHVLLLFLLALAAWLDRRRNEAASGAVLAFAAVLKLYPALFAVFFAVQRRWRGAASLLLGVAVLAWVGVALLGFEPFRVYALSIVPRALAGEGVDPYVGTASPSSLLRRLFVAEPDLNPQPLLACRTAYAITQPLLQAVLLASGLWLVGRRSDDRAREGVEWGSFVALSLVLSTAVSSYHFCVLIMATVLTIDFLVGAGRPRAAAAIAALHVLVCLPWGGVTAGAAGATGGWILVFGFLRAYAMLAYWVVLVVAVAPFAELRARPARAMALASPCLLVAISGIASNARHLASELDAPGERVPDLPRSPVIGAPAVGAGGVYFSRFSLEGWRVERVPAGAAVVAPPRVDLFSPAVAPAKGSALWLEVASRSSRVVRIATGAAEVDANDGFLEVEDGEQPAVSPDGRWLAFLREVRGRGALWLVDRGADAGESKSRATPPRQVTGATHDVLEFAVLGDGGLVYAARDGRSVGLFRVDPGPGGSIAPLPAERPARYPAVSPDGRWLAYSHEERGAWQLQLLDLRDGGRSRVTNAECNSTSPAWSPDGASLVYASDCGRGVEQTGLRRIRVSP
jgi:Glycosyltransferase family 87/WD40-like Beta Propeller Repeat